MAVVTGVFPYDIDNLLGGRVRVLYAPASEDIPTGIDDIIDMVDPYAVVGDWVDLGATAEASSYSREIESEGYDIQQASGAVLEEITNVSRSITAPLAEITPENLQILEESSAPESLSAGVDIGAQEQIKIGTFDSLSYYRVAFVAMRAQGSGVVTETSSSKTRGRMVAFCLYNCTISADESEISFEKGNLASAPVTFTGFPESGEASGEEYGTWFFEDAGTIADS